MASQSSMTPEEYAAYQRNAAAVQAAYKRNGTNSYGQPIGSTDSGITSQQASARAAIRSALGAYGLESLGDRAWNWYLSGVPIEQIMLDIRQTPEYKTRFPGMDQLAKDGHAISETDYINLETAYKQLFRQAGLPAGFYDTPADFTSYITGQVSPSELAGRLDEYKTLTYSLPPTVRQAFSDLYGMNNDDITAYIIDPTRALPILHNQMLAAQGAGAAIQSGFGNLTKTEAEQLGQLGVDFGQAVQGFGQLVNGQELFGSLIGDAGETGITRSEQLGATFGGDAAAQRRIEQRAAKRKAEFSGGGSYQSGGFGRASDG